MELDGFTLAVSALVVRTCFALVFLATWLRHRGDRHMLDWGVGVVLACVGFVCALVHPYGDYFSPLAGLVIYGLIGAGFACNWAGVARFDGRRLPVAVAALTAAAPGVLYAGLTLSGLSAAVGFAGAFVGFAFGALMLAVQLLRAPPGPRLPSRYIAAGASLVYVATFLVAAALSLAEAAAPSAVVSSDVFALAVDQLCGLLMSVALLSLAGERARALLEGRVSHDMLTNLLNRVGLLAAADALLLRGRSSDPLAVVVLDLDHFKLINDRYGHDAGDGVLVEFGRCALALIGGRGVLARYGGEEFVALLPATSAAGAHGLAEELRLAVAGRAFPGLDPGDRVTVSIGIATVAVGEHQIAPAVARADAALYEAKNAGRDRVVAWEPASRPALAPYPTAARFSSSLRKPA